MIAVVDAGLGNLRSVHKAMAAATDEAVELVAEPARLLKADRVVVPGQGAFGDSARALRPDAPLGSAVLELVRAGRPYLGICLGLQLLFDSSEEAPEAAGLGLLAGAVRRLPAGVDEEGRPERLPHIGWCHTAGAAEGRADAIARALAGWFYYVHSYAAQPTDEGVVAARARRGSDEVVAAVRRDNLLAVQFHPEKSQAAGLALLRAFARWSP
jgi:imidazole glycerol-phosphate synthase subunit HisH